MQCQSGHLNHRDGRFWRGRVGNGMSVVVFPGKFVLVPSDLSFEEGWVQGGSRGRVPDEDGRITVAATVVTSR